MKFLTLFILLTSTSMAAVLEKDGDGFRLTKNSFGSRELLDDYSRLRNLNLSVYQDFRNETFEITGNTHLTREQLDGYVSRVLNISDIALVAEPDAPYVQVVEGRDARYTTLPVYDDVTKIPASDHFIQFQFRLKYAPPTDVVRNMRPFMSRYGRIIDVPHARSVHILDTASNVKRMVELVQIIDVEGFVKGKKEIDDINEKHRKVLKKEKSVMEILIENNGIFLAVFLLLGVIMGFGVRGLVIKRIEGGW